MNKLLPVLQVGLIALLAGCQPPPIGSVDQPPPSETVESLAADPERLKVLREQCRTERHRVSDELCARVAEATNRRFMGDGNAQYTPPEDSPTF